MKLILENWKRYTHAILNEDLLIESYEQAQESVANRGSKWFKGYVFEHDREFYDRIEEEIKKNLKEEPTKQALEKLKQEKYVLHWDVAGYLLLFTLNEYIVPKDITEKQRQIALLWSYKQFISNKILDSSEMAEFVVSLITLIISKVQSAKYIPNLINIVEGSDEILLYFKRYVERYFSSIENFNPYAQGYYQQSRRTSIERFFQWNRFIRDGKKDLNSVSDFNELAELVDEARPLYQAWQEKQEQADADKGKEVLLDDKNWQIIVIHNKGAACQLGKGTDWCTAAPGLDYFKEYYKPDDPLFYILDKYTNERFQFHFGTQQFMDENDNEVSEQTEKAIMEVLSKVVPQKYNKAYEFIKMTGY